MKELTLQTILKTKHQYLMEQSIKPQRINVVDSLRGFAVVGIIIIHFLEHLNFYAFPELTAFDIGLWDTVFYIGSC